VTTSGAGLVVPGGDGGDAVLAAFGRELVAWAGVCPGDVVLDLGAGHGEVTLPALRAVGARGQVVAVDVAAELAGVLTPERRSGRLRTVAMDTLAREIAARRRLSAGAAPGADSTIPGKPDAVEGEVFGAGRFDVVVCGFGLHVMVNPVVVLAEAFRVLKPGGTLAFSVPGPCADGGWWDRFAAIAEEYRWRVTVPTGPDAATPLGGLATRLGFTGLERESREVRLPLAGPFAFWEWLLDHGNRWLYDALDPADRAVFRRRVLRTVSRSHPTGGHTVDAGAWLYRLEKPRR
jgi:SAM-dependent methyltransferase